jgi:excisionase family DNA binding protein
MMLDIETIIERAVRGAVADHLEKHPLTIPTTTSEPAARTPGHQDEGPRIYTRQQAAEVAQISLPTLHKLHNEGLVEFVKIGRSTRIDADKFDADLAAGKFSNIRHRRA